MPILVLVGFMLGAVAVAVASYQLRRGRRDFVCDPSSLPPVSILKPLKGLDEGLAENLESFAELDYPRYQIIFATASASDPAAAAARQLAERHPERDILVLAVPDADQPGWNPKICLLEAMLPHAKHDLLLISDSNVRARPGHLQRLAACFDDSTVGLSYQPVVGVGEQSAAAALENMRLTEYCGAWCVAAKILAGVDAVTGKSMLLRRAALDDIGGFASLRRVMADDQVIAERMRHGGWGTRLVPEPVQCINNRWSLGNVIDRQLRHGRIRRCLVPWIYLLEITLNPVAVSIVTWPWMPRSSAALIAVAAIGKMLIDAAAGRMLRGSMPRFRYLLLVPLKDLLAFALWATALFRVPVRWRGQSFRLGAGSQIQPLPGLPQGAVETARWPWRGLGRVWFVGRAHHGGRAGMPHVEEGAPSRLPLSRPEGGAYHGQHERRL